MYQPLRTASVFYAVPTVPEVHAVLHDGVVYEVGVVHSLPHVHHPTLDGEVDLVPAQSLHGLAL